MFPESFVLLLHLIRAFLLAARLRTRFQDSRRIGETFSAPVYHTAARRTCG
jgi:hypothetical protein